MKVLHNLTNINVTTVIRAQFLEVISGIGIVLDIAVVVYHALSPLKIDSISKLIIEKIIKCNITY